MGVAFVEGMSFPEFQWPDVIADRNRGDAIVAPLPSPKPRAR